jgi:GMP synthase (glutamine-hydrolysing)
VAVLHVINQTGGPAGVFLPVLAERGFAVEDVEPGRDGVPESVDGYEALLLTGGSANTHETERYPWIPRELALVREALARDVPVFGLCLGAQMLTLAAGGVVYPASAQEVGWYEVERCAEATRDRLFAALPARFPALQWHYYACELPAGAVVLARNENAVQAFRIGTAAWGTQFHIEVTREILLDWAAAAPGELERHGYDPARYVAELDRHLPRHEAIGRALAERFAEVVRARSERAA